MVCELQFHPTPTAPKPLVEEQSHSWRKREAHDVICWLVGRRAVPRDVQVPNTPSARRRQTTTNRLDPLCNRTRLSHQQQDQTLTSATAASPPLAAVFHRNLNLECAVSPQTEHLSSTHLEQQHDVKSSAENQANCVSQALQSKVHLS